MASALRQPGRHVGDLFLEIAVVPQPSPQPTPPPMATRLVRQHVAGHVQQPRERAVGRDVVPAPQATRNVSAATSRAVS
jgi:hypothetical protein